MKNARIVALLLSLSLIAGAACSAGNARGPAASSGIGGEGPGVTASSAGGAPSSTTSTSASTSASSTATSSGLGGASGSGGSTSSTGGAGGGAGGGAAGVSTSASSGSGGSDAGGCTSGTTQPCMTSCGSTGQETCSGGAWGACVPPQEVCNLKDDDCSGQCDDILGCRIGVDRSDDTSKGIHFYTTTDSEAGCCGYTVETYDYYYLYETAQPGLVPFYRCRTSTDTHLYTTDANCDGATLEGTMGYIATSSVCGSVPLYHLYAASSGDHFYTTSSAEVSSAQSGGYVLEGTAGYVWSANCGGTSCTWPSPIHMVGSTTTGVTGFPTAWYGFPVAPGAQAMTTLSGTVSVTNSANLYAEVLFILEVLPSGACQSGLLPSSTPEYGPPGARSLAQFIVKAPTEGTFTLPINLTLPGGVPISNCVLLGLNGGSVATAHSVTSAADLTLAFAPAPSPAQSILGAGGEFCFGQSNGCQAATTNDALSFANVSPISQATTLIALYGDISDSTFDGTSAFGAPPAGAWTATNDFYIYHGAECSAFGVKSGTAGPGNYYASIPADAVHLLSVPLSGSGIGVVTKQVYTALGGVTAASGDCLVTLWGLEGGGGFDNETQVFALAQP